MKIVKNYYAGKWIDEKKSHLLDVENPSTGEIIAKVPLSGREVVDEAVQSAAAAYQQWKNVPVSARVEPLFRLAAMLRANEEKIARVLTEEMGKSLPDARAELKRTFENVEVACGMPVHQQGELLMGASMDIDGEVLRLPMGVFAMIAPFNFPAMVPFWFLPYAIAAGNTFIVKSSPQVPLTMEMITGLIDQCGLPAGVFSLINGDQVASEALVEHPLVRGISLVGSSSTCQVVAENCVKHKKRFQAMGGAKNHLVVMPDAKIDDAVRNMITSCFGCAGQRCMASSVIVGVGQSTYQTICRLFIEETKQIIVANPLDEKVAREKMVMGPVISGKSKQFILKMIETGIDEGANLALDGRNLVIPGCEKGHFLGPTVFTDVKPGMEIHKTEIFGPVVIIMQAVDLDEAIRIINEHPYGNGASIYTQNGFWARRFKIETQCGMIGINIGIPAPVASLPFGGMKSSLFSDIKAQGKSVINFFTEEKTVTQRFWPESP